VATRVVGLDEFRRELGRLENAADWERELKQTHVDVGERAADWARFRAARFGTRQQQLATDAINGKGTARQATITVTRTTAVPYALAAFWGQKKQSGWYGAPKYRNSSGKQAPKWVGAGWEYAVKGQGPYHINDALAEHLDDVLEFYAEAIDRLAKRAFPSP
jgi:hypothetical protein